ncbi:MAG: carbohydrate ABC transporter permease [Ruminiclostridium sp.]|nr:carbohydrate ABC transporter permease [Ruminiclostridium sp.]
MDTKTNFRNSIFSSIVLLIAAVFFLFPLFWMVSGSFKPSMDNLKIPPDLFPFPPVLDNFRELILKGSFFRWFFNSFFVSAITTFLIVIVSSMAGYSLSKKRFYGRNVLFYTIAMSIMIPRQILLVPLFTVVKTFNMFDTYAGLILPAIGWPLGIFLMRQFIITLPNELLDASIIDGCGEIRKFITIVFPMAKPGIGALAIFTFVDSWNDYLWQLLVTKSKNMYTLPLGIANLQQLYSTDFGLLMAGAVVSALPTIVIFLRFQKYFTKGITLGAIKG